MIVQRITMRVKAERMEEWVAVLKTNHDKWDHPEFSRIYVSHSDPELVVQDLEFEDLAAKGKFWEEWAKRPEYTAIVKAYHELEVEAPGDEYWTLK
jgi:hypothetical protein